jgi:hypothetical protein
MKQAVMTSRECHIEAGIEPYTGDIVNCDMFEYAAANARMVAAFIDIATRLMKDLKGLCCLALAANAFSSFSKFSAVNEASAALTAALPGFSF